MARKTEVKVIKIIVQTDKSNKDLQKLARSFGRTEKSVKSMSNSMSRMKHIFIGMFAGVGIRSMTRVMDTMQLMQDRMKVFTGSTEKAKIAFYELAKGAKFVRSSIATLGDAYNKIAVATSDLGFNSKEVLGIVLALQQTLRLSGAAAQEASSVFLQFGQALSLGRIQGQELRAIMLGNAKYTQILADALNINKGVLKNWGELGKLTNDKILTALMKNFKSLNEDVKSLGQTFEQSFIIGLDMVNIKLKELNEAFKLNEKFAGAVAILMDNFNSVMAVAATGGVMLLISSLSGLAIAFSGAALASVALMTSAFFVQRNWSVLSKYLDVITVKIAKVGVAAVETSILMRQQIPEMLGGLSNDEVAKGLKKTTLALKGLNSVLKDEENELMKRMLAEKDNKDKNPVKTMIDDIVAGIPEMLRKLKTSGASKNTAGIFKELNEQFSDKSMVEYSRALSNLKITALNEKFKQGKITLIEYKKSLKDIVEAYRDIERGDGVWAGIEEGANKAMKSVGTLANQISGVVSGAFDNLEDRLFDFVKKGKFEFRKFAEAILDDITRVIIRMSIIQPLASAVGGFAAARTTTTNVTPTVASNTQFATPSAMGNIFNQSGITPFAKGGVVNSPTIFPFANGTGLMGEDGPEAIMPLKRGRDGKLGVSGGGTVVNVINNSSNTETETRESTGPSGEKQIDVLIVNKVGAAISEGRMDRIFKQNYGLNRRGS